MARRTKEDALKTRSDILDTAERVFSERGVSRTSLADIAAAAGVTRGAIYWHFRDKADLFCEMVARATFPMEDAPCRVDHAAAADPIASIRAMMVAILRRTAEDPQARRVFHIVFHKCEYVDEMKPVWKRLNEMQAACLTGIEQGLRAAVERGRAPPGLDAHRAALGLHALLDGLISRWVIEPESMQPRRRVEPLVDLFLDGLQRPGLAKRKRAPRSNQKKPGAKSATAAGIPCDRPIAPGAGAPRGRVRRAK